MGRKGKSFAYYQIVGIPNDEEFRIIYNHIEDGMYILEKVFKKNYKIRKFDISEVWQYKFENGIATFDKVDKLKNIPLFLELDLRTIFLYAHKSWQYELRRYEYYDKISFMSTMKNKFGIGVNKSGKWIWLENGFERYTKDIFDEI